METMAFATLIWFGKAHHPLRQLWLTWINLVAVSDNANLRRGINLAKRQAKTKDLTKMKRLALDFLETQGHETSMSTLRKQTNPAMLKAIMEGALHFINMNHFTMQDVRALAMPVCDDRDDEEALSYRTEFDERLTVPIEALLMIGGRI